MSSITCGNASGRSYRETAPLELVLDRNQSVCLCNKIKLPRLGKRFSRFAMKLGGAPHGSFTDGILIAALNHLETLRN